jgi:DNA-binding NarL/FixJ family response regulator
MPDPIRVAIVDPSPQMQTAIASLLAGQRDVEIVHHAGRLSELQGIAGPAADVIVADVRSVNGHGHSSVRAVRQQWPGARLIVMSLGEDREYELAAADLAADRWMPKTRLARDLLQTIKALGTAAL